MLVAPGVSASPTPRTNLSIEYGFAWRINDKDAAYAGGMRAYTGTQNVSGHEIGNLFRLVGSLTLSKHMTVFFNYEHLNAGLVLNEAGLPSASYMAIGTTYRF